MPYDGFEPSESRDRAIYYFAVTFLLWRTALAICASALLNFRIVIKPS